MHLLHETPALCPVYIRYPCTPDRCAESGLNNQSLNSATIYPESKNPNIFAPGVGLAPPPPPARRRELRSKILRAFRPWFYVRNIPPSLSISIRLLSDNQIHSVGIYCGVACAWEASGRLRCEVLAWLLRV